MKKFIALFTIIITVAFLTSCINQNEFAPQQGVIRSAPIEFFAEDGLFYNDADSILLKFFDVDSKKSVPLCNKPECTHEDNSCFAYQGISEFFIYNDKIYTFGEMGEIHTRNFDGSEKQKVIQLGNDIIVENLNTVYGYRGTVKDDILYATYILRDYNEDTGEEVDTGILSKIDMRTMKEEIIFQEDNKYLTLYLDNDEESFYLTEFTPSEIGVEAIVKISQINMEDYSLDFVIEGNFEQYSSIGIEDNKVNTTEVIDDNSIRYSQEIISRNPIKLDEKKKLDYYVIMEDERGNVIFDYTDDTYKILYSDGSKENLESKYNAKITPIGELKDGYVFIVDNEELESSNGLIKSSDRFFVTKDDFYNDVKNIYPVN